MQTLVGRQGTPGEGPFMLFVLKVDGQTIAEAKFSTYACPAAQACGQCVAEYIEGKAAKEVSSVDEAWILKTIGQMPLGREHCPGLAANALRDALQQLAVN